MRKILEVKNLRTSFFTHLGEVEAVRGSSFSMNEGDILGIVGESGSGKSVTALSIINLIDEPGRIIDGSIIFDGKELTKLHRKEMSDIRGNDIAMIFQDPMTSLNPVFSIENQMVEVIRRHTDMTRAQAKKHAVEMLELVGIPQPEERISSYPFEYSGGMRQRVLIAIALACKPDILIADEPTTALDVTIQAQVLELMNGLQQETGMAIIFITHDLGVIAEICDDVVVMYAGKVAETAPVKELFKNPKHPYTKGLLLSIPRLESQRKTKLSTIEGIVPSLDKLPRGCRFHNRCPYAHAPCETRPPDIKSVGNNHFASCYLL